MSDGPGDPLPDWTYIPGGPWPHPNRADRPSYHAGPIVEDDWRGSPTYLRGVELFESGYYWESHEAWEALWHAHGRIGPTANVLKALIKLAAAGVKVRERQPRGVATHARRAAELFRSVAGTSPRLLGLDLATWAEIADRIADDPPANQGPSGAAVVRVFAFELRPA